MAVSGSPCVGSDVELTCFNQPTQCCLLSPCSSAHARVLSNQIKNVSDYHTAIKHNFVL